jgi:hypothetical protein
MEWWYLPAPTTPDERVTFEAAANVWQGRRAVGGKVTVTNRRLLFTPNRMDAAMGGRGMAVGLPEIQEVGVVPPGGRPRPLGPFWRRVVAVAHADAHRLFLVREPDEMVAALTDHLV